MMVDLKGLLSKAGSHCESADRTYGALYALSLLELGDHIRGLLRGEHTAEEFAKHYMLDLTDKEPWVDPGPQEEE